jgi:hypothetical protein
MTTHKDSHMTPSSAELHDLNLAATFENTLAVRGIHRALQLLNATTPYRLTGVYRFEGGLVRSVALFDRKNPHLLAGVDVPWQDSYCRLAAEDGTRYQIVDAPHDPRLTTHAARATVQAYVAVLLKMPNGSPLGTLCHYDLEPVMRPVGVFEDLDAVSPVMERSLWAMLQAFDGLPGQEVLLRTNRLAKAGGWVSS